MRTKEQASVQGATIEEGRKKLRASAFSCPAPCGGSCSDAEPARSARCLPPPLPDGGDPEQDEKVGESLRRRRDSNVDSTTRMRMSGLGSKS